MQIEFFKCFEVQKGSKKTKKSEIWSHSPYITKIYYIEMWFLESNIS